MRQTTEKKAETRERIMHAAIGLFRQHGVDAVGVDAVMRAAGLTHGGFYGHFPSKEALVGEVAAASLARAATRWEQTLEQEGPAGLATIVRDYLDPSHVAAADRGCVLTTIGPDVSRRPEQLPAIGQSVRRMIAVLDRGMAGLDDHDAPHGNNDRALAALATMVGAVMLARLADDPAAGKAVLRAAHRAVLAEDQDADQDPAPDAGRDAGSWNRARGVAASVADGGPSPRSCLARRTAPTSAPGEQEPASTDAEETSP